MRKARKKLFATKATSTAAGVAESSYEWQTTAAAVSANAVMLAMPSLLQP